MGSANFTAPAAKRRVECLPPLRAVAATLVVMYHTDLQLFRLSDGAHVPWAGFGAAGTDLLFVISGFTMVYLSHGKRMAMGDFLFRRIARVTPLYWLCTLGMLAAFLAVPGFFHSTAVNSAHVLASLAFVPYTHPVLGILKPFLVPGWALNEIMFFYLVFALFLFLPSGSRVVMVAVILGVLAALRWRLFGASHLLDFYGAPVILEFVFGMLVAWTYLERRRLPFAAVVVALVASVAIFAAGVQGNVGGTDARVFYWGLADSGFLLFGAFHRKEWGWWNFGLLTLLGEASFSTYLTNLFSLAVFAKAVQLAGLFPIIGSVGTEILLVVGSLAVGVATSLLIEQPLHAFVLNYRARRFRAPGLVKPPRDSPLSDQSPK